MVGPSVLTSIDLGKVLELELELELVVVVEIHFKVVRAAVSLYSIQCVVYSNITVCCHFMVILQPVYSLQPV